LDALAPDSIQKGLTQKDFDSTISVLSGVTRQKDEDKAVYTMQVNKMRR
jgi:hypothetical protein